MRQLATMAMMLVSLSAMAQVKPATSASKAASSATEKRARVVNPAMKPFIGTWKLVSTEETLPDGTKRPYGFGPHGIGYLMYDATGHMCAQVVNPDRPMWVDPDHPTGDEVKTALDGFGGYCGTYTVDVEKHTMSHLPEISFDPNIVGKAVPRNYVIEGTHLTYSGTDRVDSGESHWTMTWEKLP